MKNTRYSSPERQKEAKISVNKAETRIKYRREILEELEKERLEKQRDAATLTSMQKTEGHDSEGEEGEVGLQSGSEEEELD